MSRASDRSGCFHETTRVGYLEVYFDHPRWGRDTLTPLVADGALRVPELADANLLHVVEEAPLDAA